MIEDNPGWASCVVGAAYDEATMTLMALHFLTGPEAKHERAKPLLRLLMTVGCKPPENPYVEAKQRAVDWLAENHPYLLRLPQIDGLPPRRES